jgi:hypothetical protein
MHLLTFVKIIHLMGLIMGLGGAVLLDFTILTRGIIRPVSKYTIHQTEVLSRIVSIGLAVLWVTGIGLIWLNLADKPEYLTNQKLWAKIAIVVLLTINGVVIHNRVIPMLKQKTGQRLFDNVEINYIALLTGIGAISLTSWITPFILGKASELNYVTPMSTILLCFLGALITVWLSMFTIITSLRSIQSVMLNLAAKTVKPSEAWETMETSNAELATVLHDLAGAMQSALQPKATHVAQSIEDRSLAA